jgi:hypothetical protein
MPLMHPLLRSLFVAASLALAGCASGDSLVEKGQRLRTGKDRFDVYFGEVVELSERVKRLDSDLFPLRQPLTEAFDVGVDTPLSRLMEVTRERIAKLKAFGVTTSLRLAPSPIVVVHHGDFSQDEVDEVTLRAVQEAAVRALTTYREYAQDLETATRLDETRAKLAEQLEKLGPNQPDRAKVEAELRGTARVLANVQGKLLTDMRTCSLMLVALSEAVDTGGAAGRDASCDEAMAHWKPARRSYGRGRVRGSAPPAARGPSGGGAAPPPKKGGGDFDM